MFILYALVFGFVGGALLGGRIGRLAELRLHWIGLAVAGLIVQLVLFSPVLSDRVGGLGPPIYIGSTLAVLVFVLRNVTVPGLLLVALGSLSNLVAILANGGYMPASPAALATLATEPGDGYSNSLETATPAFAPLTDIFALPPEVPFANIFSVGDVLIGLGIGAAVACAMLRRPANEQAAERSADRVPADAVSAH